MGTHTWAVCRINTKKNAKKNREDPSNPIVHTLPID